MFEELISLLFIASVKSQKTINALQIWVSLLLKRFIKVTLQNCDSKQRRKKHCHQMHDKPKYEKKNEMLISLEIGWVKYLGEFYVIFFLGGGVRLTAYSLRKPLQNNNNKKKMCIQVFKNGFIQRNSFLWFGCCS
uniref:Uncharacterized protein n=1 Tax=Pelusios castaneus TaxID=367368 RepID=A0A8C8VM15_9SAUR